MTNTSPYQVWKRENDSATSTIHSFSDKRNGATCLDGIPESSVLALVLVDETRRQYQIICGNTGFLQPQWNQFGCSGFTAVSSIKDEWNSQ